MNKTSYDRAEAVLVRMRLAHGRMSVRSLTRKLAEAGLRVEVWRRASAEAVRGAFESGSLVVMPRPSTRRAGVSLRWDSASRNHGVLWSKLERLWLELLLLDWQPKGTVIIVNT